jgi:hypothetical protein
MEPCSCVEDPQHADVLTDACQAADVLEMGYQHAVVSAKCAAHVRPKAQVSWWALEDLLDHRIVDRQQARALASK